MNLFLDILLFRVPFLYPCALYLGHKLINFTGLGQIILRAQFDCIHGRVYGAVTRQDERFYKEP